MQRRYDIRLTEARKLAKELARSLKGGETLALVGALGSGKTTFTQALGAALGVKHKIHSPTFIVMQEFPTTRKTSGHGKTSKQPIWLIHADLYRTADFREVRSTGIPELWTKPNIITVIEWADKIKKYLPSSTIYIHLTRDVTDAQ